MEIIKPIKKTNPVITANPIIEESAGTGISTAETMPSKLATGFKFTGLIQSTPEMLDSLRDSVEIIVDQRMEQNMRFMEERFISILENKLNEFSRIIPKDTTLVDVTKSEIMNKILERNHDYLVQNYKGKFVGLTFDGKIVVSSPSEFDLLNQIESLEVPKEQIFVYSVPLL